MEKGKTNGLDVTLKCISMMLRKAIVVLAEDYLWLTHRRDLKDIELVMIMREDGKCHGLRRMDGRLLKCNLSYLKDWMQSQSNKMDDEQSSENTEHTESTKDHVDNGSQNTDSMDRSQPDIENGAENTEIIEKHVHESYDHLNVKDIKSSDSEVLVPSSNAAIAGLSNIPYNVSDTTFDDSVQTVNTVNNSVDNITSDQCNMESGTVRDSVVQSGIVDGINDKDVMENTENTINDKENLEVTGKNVLPMNADVTETESTMEVSTHSMGTDKSSYKESDAGTSESRESNISLQYLADEGKN